MSELVILFEEVISQSGGGLRGSSIIYYYKDNKFYKQEDWSELISRYSNSVYLEVLLQGNEISFEEFKNTYVIFKKEYCFDDLIDKTIREHQLKNLLN